MSMYFISDLHLWHDRGFIYKPRGFESIEDMNKTILENWHNTIKEDDEVYLLGDVALGTDYDLISETVGSLPGKLHIMIGNHDTDKKIEIYRSLPNVVEVVYATIVKIGKYSFYLSHYQTKTASLETPPEHALYNIHGHIHTKDKFFQDNPYFYNVSCDSQNCMPIKAEDMIAEIEAEVQNCIGFLDL